MRQKFTTLSVVASALLAVTVTHVKAVELDEIDNEMGIFENRFIFSGDNFTINLLPLFLFGGLLLGGFIILGILLGSPQGTDEFSSYTSPLSDYGAPSPAYGAPAPDYGAPSTDYGAPQPSYDQPSSGYGAPQATYQSTNYAFAKRRSLPSEQAQAASGHADTVATAMRRGYAAYAQDPASHRAMEIKA